MLYFIKMASKRKQDDKHLKLLREMVSREHNKTCFECSQRGPTYVDMTIGTFVCTSCSGILRGLNPPHRVKSISMASYSSTEMDFLEKHGNEVNRHVWLGLCNTSAQRGPESKEDSKVRDYLVQKYEKKRWYVEPGQAAILAAAKAKEEHSEKKNSSSSSSHSTPEPKPLKSLVGSNPPPIKVLQPPGHSASAHNIGKTPTLAQTATKQKSVDLLADLGPDPFAAQSGGFGQTPFGQQAQAFGQQAQAFGQPTPFQQSAAGQQNAFPQTSQQQGGFANFSQAFGAVPSSQACPEIAKPPSTSIASKSTDDLADLFFPSNSTQLDDPCPEIAKPPSTSIASKSTDDLADLFFPSNSTQLDDPFMPAAQTRPSQPAAAAAASSNNSFGAFESAFSPQQPATAAPTPAASSSGVAGAPVLASSMQGLSLANTAPVASVPAPATAAAAGDGDKYAAFASLGGSLGGETASSGAGGSVNWSGGGGAGRPSTIDWGPGGGVVAGAGGGVGVGGGGLDARSTASQGFDWGGGMQQKSAAGYGMPGTFTTTTTSSSLSSAGFGTVPFGGGAAAVSGGIPTSNMQQGNPFMAMSSGGATQPTSTMLANPFLAGGVPVATSIGGNPAQQTNGLFGMQQPGVQPGVPNPAMMGGVGGFNQMPMQQPTQQQPGGAGGAGMQMNGRVGVGYPQGQMAAASANFAMQPNAMPNQFGMQPGQPGMPAASQFQQTPAGGGGGVGFGGAGMAAMAGLQFSKVGQPAPAGMGGMGQMGAPQQVPQQGQQFAAWGATPGAVPQQNANPFMGGGFGQTGIPPKSNTSNPFL